MSLWGMPGIGGGLGRCAVCGDAFIVEIFMNKPIKTVEIDGIDETLCIHDRCMETLEDVRGRGWENLPNGPLRAAYEKAAEAGDLAGEGTDAAR